MRNFPLNESVCVLILLAIIVLPSLLLCVTFLVPISFNIHILKHAECFHINLMKAFYTNIHKISLYLSEIIYN